MRFFLCRIQETRALLSKHELPMLSSTEGQWKPLFQFFKLSKYPEQYSDPRTAKKTFIIGCNK